MCAVSSRFEIIHSIAPVESDQPLLVPIKRARDVRLATKEVGCENAAKESWLVGMVEKRASKINAGNFLRLHCAFVARSVSCSSHSSRRRRKPEIVQRSEVQFLCQESNLFTCSFLGKGRGRYEAALAAVNPKHCDT